MKKNMIIVSIVLVSIVTPTMAQCYRSGVYIRPGWGRPCYSPPPCYGPRYYHTWQPAPFVLQQRVTWEPAPPPAPSPYYGVRYETRQAAPPPPPVSQPAATQPTVIQLQFPPGFVETGRRYHKHGSDAGTIDWVKGTIGKEKWEITFNADGTRRSMDKD